MKRGLTEEAIYCSAPSYLVASLRLTLPFDNRKKIEAVLPFEIDDRLPIDVEDIIYDYLITDSAEDSSQILVSYARKADLSQFLSALNEVDIDPKEINFGPLLLSHITKEFDEQAGAQLVVDLGHHHTQVALVVEDKVRQSRDIGLGMSLIVREYMETLQLNDVDALEGITQEGTLYIRSETDREQVVAACCRRGIKPLIRELKRTLLSLVQNERVEVGQIILVGGGSRLGGIDTFLAESLEVPCMIHHGVSFKGQSPVPASESVLYCKAASLTDLKYSSKNGRLNLRQGELAYTGDFSRVQGQIIGTSLAVMVCLILLALLGVAKKQALEARNAQLKREVAKLSMDILGKENTEISALTQALEEDFTADFSAIPPRSVTELLYEISDKLDPELVIDVDRLEINLERKSLVMQGKTPKPSDVETLTDTLEKMSCFRDVQQERVEAAGENTRFRISATATCVQGGSS